MRKTFVLLGLIACVMTSVALAETPVELKPINVKDFGAKGDGVTDDTVAINAAIVAAQKMGSGAVVSLPSGRYKTATGAEKSIRIKGADGLIFQGAGDTTIVSGDLDEPVFRIDDSKSVTVRKISIDHDPLGYTQGTITSVDIPNMTCEVSIDPGYPPPNDPSFKGAQVHPFVFPEKNYYQLDRHWPNPIEMVKTGEHTWSWKLQGPPNIENWPGKRFFIYTESRSQAFMLSNLSDTTLEDINYWGGGANAGYYIRGLEGTTTFRRFVIGVPPGSNRLYSCAGGGQVSGLRGKLLLDQCDFSKIDDDGIDILADYTRIIEQRDKRTLLVQAKKHDYRTGDRVELWDWQHKKMRMNAIITTATPNPDGTFVIALDRDVVTDTLIFKGLAFVVLDRALGPHEPAATAVGEVEFAFGKGRDQPQARAEHQHDQHAAPEVRDLLGRRGRLGEAAHEDHVIEICGEVTHAHRYCRLWVGRPRLPRTTS